MNHRSEIETAIIGACILESPTIGQVQHILKPVNFSTPDRQQLWAAMQQIYPGRLDMLILCHYMNKHHRQEGKNWAYTIASYTQHVHSAANVVNWAFILLERCFEDQVKHILNDLLKHYQKDVAKQNKLGKIIEAVEDEQDVFLLINKLAIKCKEYSLYDASKEIEELQNKIDKRVMQIKEYDQVDHLERSLNKANEKLQEVSV